MLLALIVVVVVAVAAVAFLVLRLRRAQGQARSWREQRAQAERRAGQSDARLADTQAELTAARSSTDTLRAELGAARAEVEAARIRARNAARTPAGPDSRLDALWALGDLEARRSGYVPASEAAVVGVDPLASLRLALTAEVTRIREEIGTPGELEIGQLPILDKGDSLVLGRAVQALLAALARHCDAYDLRLEQEAEQAKAVVTCERWEGPDRSADDMSALLAALESIGGELDLDRDDAGRLRASLSVPVTPIR